MQKRNIIFGLLLIMTVLFMTSCSLIDNDGGRYGFEDEAGDIKGTPLEDLAEYTVVRGDLCSDGDKQAYVKFRETVNKNLNIELDGITDWIGEGQQEREKEILIGETNRKESIEAMEGLGYNDYVIKKVGTKLIIAGGSGTSTGAAVDYFIENYINIYQATLSYPEEGYKYTQSYILSSVTIDGVPISDYKLYANDPEIDLTDIQQALSDDIVGAYLEIAESTDAYTKYIVFDRTGLIAAEYGTTLEDDGNLYVYGSYDTIDDAKEYFKGPYFEELAADKGTKDIDITWHDDKVKESGKKEIYTKEALISLLTSVAGDPDKIIVGETLGGSQSMPDYTLKNYYDASGKYPAMLGIDLACYGLQLPEMSSEDWSEAICQIVDYASNGGIITATSHFENPTGNWVLGDRCRGILGGEDKWEELLTEGTDLNVKFKRELAIDAAFLDALHDNGVPVLWRPLNESNTASYWFGAVQGDVTVGAEYLKRLWIYIYDYYQSLGLDNLIWVYSPAVTEGEMLSVMYAYPGDEYVDIVGCDWSTAGGEEINSGEKPYASLIATGKIGAVCEFSLDVDSGMIASTREEQTGVFSSLDLLDTLYSLRAEGCSFAYLLTKGGTSSVSWLGEAQTFVDDEMILTLDDVAMMLGIGG